LLSRFRAGETTVGTFIGLGGPLSAEVAAVSGVDWVLLDLEHGGGSEDQLSPTVVAAGAYGVPTLVRVESADRIRIGRALDAGAAGVMVPRVNNLSEVENAVKHFSYPPFGDRGVATYNRAARWGKDPEALLPPTKAACIIQIETLGSLEVVEDIAALDGVDVLFVGPLDLSFALGVPRQFDDPTFIKSIERVVSAANAANKPAGILAVDAKAAKKYLNMGFKFVAVGSDSTLLAKAITDAITEIKEN
jgi:2-dehydro-3-deoxyglucarate aldolase/4-hydroxy-2-oxoheptanedioate aldolase